MKKELKKTSGIFYIKDGKQVEGMHENLYGDVCGISGNVCGIYGDVSGISGNVSRISGDVSGIYGDVSRIYGDVDNCNLTKKERENGVNINDLIKEETITNIES